MVVTPGDFIINAGERGRDMYFINQGAVEVLAPDGVTLYRNLADGDCFGEIALVLDEDRSASVRALTYCDMYRLDKTLFDRILSHYPTIAEQIHTLAKERMRR